MTLPARAVVDLPTGVTAAVTADASYNVDTGLFTYTYTVSNNAASAQEIAAYDVTVTGSIINVTNPYGWQATVHADGKTVSWCACDELGIVEPPGYVDDGNVLPSIYQIKPGKSLAGFSFQSPDPPDFGPYFIQGFVKIPVEGTDVMPGQDPVVPDWPANSVSGTTKVPLYSETLFPGGRRPPVDGFLQFKNIQNRDVKPAPVLIDIVFATNGETVNQTTFRATLNNIDVTDQFNVTGPNARRAIFVLGPGSLTLGRNVLLTSVQGVVPGTTRTANDVDRVSFTVK